jgi:hypothetical protein
MYPPNGRGPLVPGATREDVFVVQNTGDTPATVELTSDLSGMLAAAMTAHIRDITDARQPHCMYRGPLIGTEFAPVGVGFGPKSRRVYSVAMTVPDSADNSTQRLTLKPKFQFVMRQQY